jgi:hypothetical protein
MANPRSVLIQVWSYDFMPTTNVGLHLLIIFLLGSSASLFHIHNSDAAQDCLWQQLHLAISEFSVTMPAESRDAL